MELDVQSTETSPQTPPDEAGSHLCKQFFEGSCTKGKWCNLKHVPRVRDLVCCYYLEDKCRKGSYCEYLHERNQEKTPECRILKQKGFCPNPDCKFRHSVEDVREEKECIFYSAGFCPKGALCKFKHIKKELCMDYHLLGFCRKGTECLMVHLKDIDEASLASAYYALFPGTNVRYEDSFQLCFRCMGFGHKAAKCVHPSRELPSMHGRKIVRCFRCGVFDHKANECPEGQAKRRCTPQP